MVAGSGVGGGEGRLGSAAATPAALPAGCGGCGGAGMRGCGARSVERSQGVQGIRGALHAGMEGGAAGRLPPTQRGAAAAGNRLRAKGEKGSRICSHVEGA